jgi:hypothetical protein
MTVKENLTEYHNFAIRKGKLSQRIKIEYSQHNY